MSNTLQSQQHHQQQQKQKFSVSFWSLICQFFENVLTSNCPAFLLIGPFHLPMTSVSFTNDQRFIYHLPALVCQG